jgi:hypothetical protein
MYTFRPLNGEGAVIANIPVTVSELQSLRNTLVMALDHNPSTPKFAEAMAPARALVGDDTLTRWVAELQKIRTEGEREGHINFTFEDWITHWHIADFIDRKWTVAGVECVWPAESTERAQEVPRMSDQPMEDSGPDQTPPPEL